MSALASGTGWMSPPPPPPPPDGVPRENVRLLVQALGVAPDDLRELRVEPSRVVFQTVVRDEAGHVVMRDGLATYQVHVAQIIEPTDPNDPTA